MKGALFLNWSSSRCDEMGVMIKSVPLSSFGFLKLQKTSFLWREIEFTLTRNLANEEHLSVMLVPTLREESTLWLLEYAFTN